MSERFNQLKKLAQLDPYSVTKRDRNVDQPGQYLPLLAKERVNNKFLEI